MCNNFRYSQISSCHHGLEERTGNWTLFRGKKSRWTAGSPARFSWCKVWRGGGEQTPEVHLETSQWSEKIRFWNSWIYPLPSSSGGWKFFFVYWCLLESPGEHVIRCMFCSSNANGHSTIDCNSSAQRGRLEHSKCQTVCWICIWFDPFRASSALFQATSSYFDHEHVDPHQSWFRVDLENLNRMYKHLWYAVHIN